LERHWDGTLLDELDPVLKFAQSITWRNKHPVVKLVTTIYETGVRLTRAAMPVFENTDQAPPLSGKLVCRNIAGNPGVGGLNFSS
jgi:hypothetical protein